jgi:succinate dehydrogenase / fumarate reductase flavoprotein subunit
VAPGIVNMLKSQKDKAAEGPAKLYETARQQHEQNHQRILKRRGGENPYLIHQELGQIMTRAATVVRYNDVLKDAIGKVEELERRAGKCSLADTGSWTNQNVVFTKALIDMFPLARTILQGALARDESRGAHFKPDFTMPGLAEGAGVDRHREAESWCDAFDENTRKWLKTTVAEYRPDGEVALSYEDVDTSLITPRPRLYGLVGAEVIEEVWKERQAEREAAKKSSPDGNGAPRSADYAQQASG